MADSIPPVLHEDDDGTESVLPASFDGEDFLFHLYRGSELLQDNCVAEAKEELERALAMQPRDAGGQALLGAVYFRLGLYPRAIGIYEDLVRAFPAESTPRTNLALCFLKTGQHAAARDLLEQVVARRPEHLRAWGYLGLAFDRLGDLQKAREAFARAKQGAMVARLERRIAAAQEGLNVPDPDRDNLRQAAAEAVLELEIEATPFSHAEATLPGDSAWQAGRWQALEPGRGEPIRASSSRPPPQRPPTEPGDDEPAGIPPGVAASPAAFLAAHALPDPVAGAAVCGERLVVVRVPMSLVVRAGAILACLPDHTPFRFSPAYRRARGKNLDEPLGGVDAGLGSLEGCGRVVVGATRAKSRLAPLALDTGDVLYLREDFLVGFEGSIRHESGRLPHAEAGQHEVVQLSGQGTVILELEGQLGTLPVTGDAVVQLAEDRVVGWIGRLLPRVLSPDAVPGGGRGYIGFSGTGAILFAHR